jgi:hemoglobin
METAITTPPDHRAHVEAIRRRKRAEAEAIGIDEALVDRVVESFYARIRSDALLGPVFADRIADWPPHLAKMKQFWRSVLLGSGEFSGNPMVKHQAIPGLAEHHFSHWLALFYQTLRDECPQSEGVTAFGQRARMIAESLLIGVEMHRNGQSPPAINRSLPHV